MPHRCDPSQPLCEPSHNHHRLYPIPIAPLVWYHVGDLPYDLWTTSLHFPFLVSSLLPNAFFRGLTNHRSSHCAIRTLPYVSLHTDLVLILLIICIQDFCIYSEKEGSFPRELRLKFISSHHFTSLRLRTFVPLLYLILLTPFALLHRTEPLSRTTVHSLILRQETISLLQNCTPQNHIGYTLRSPSPLIFVAS